MQTPFNPSRLSHLYRPAIVLLSTYTFVNLAGFFLQHDFSKSSPIIGVNHGSVSAVQYLMFEEQIPITPAPPKEKLHRNKKNLSSGKVINPHLP